MFATPRRALGIGIVVAAAIASPAFASDVVERARAERLAAAGKCDEALASLGTLAAADPQDARVAFMLGSCQLQLDRYEEALVSLKRAKQLDPKLPDIDLEIATASFHSGDYEGTLGAVADGRNAGSTRPELDLYEGLALYGLQRNPSEAAQRLEIAAQRGGQPLGSVASYYAGMAWQSAGESDRAEGLLQGVIEEYPGTEWASAAQRALDGPTTATTARRMWGFIRAGIEWDSNAAFVGRGVELPQEIDGQSDFRGVLEGEIAAEVWKRGPWTIGVRADYYSSYNFDLRDFDLQYPGGGAWVDYALSPTQLLRLDYAIHYGWLGYDPFVFANGLTPQYFHTWGPRAGTSRFWVQGFSYDFYDNSDDVAPGPGQTGEPCQIAVPCGPPGINEEHARNRDGYGVAAGVDHTVPVQWINGEIWGGVFGETYQSDGTEYDYNGYGARVGFRSQLPAQFSLAIWTGFTHRPYDNPSTYPNPDNPQLRMGEQYALSNDDRTDDIFEFEIELARPITQNLIGSIRYGYLSNDSNVAVYDYDSNVVGAYITWTFSR